LSSVRIDSTSALQEAQIDFYESCEKGVITKKLVYGMKHTSRQDLQLLLGKIFSSNKLCQLWTRAQRFESISASIIRGMM
jgi:hypothetical protein